MAIFFGKTVCHLTNTICGLSFLKCQSAVCVIRSGYLMGLFWDLVQQSQIIEQSSVSESLEERVTALESQLQETRALQHQLLKHLETHFGRDIDGDGHVG